MGPLFDYKNAKSTLETPFWNKFTLKRNNK